MKLHVHFYKILKKVPFKRNSINTRKRLYKLFRTAGLVPLAKDNARFYADYFRIQTRRYFVRPWHGHIKS